MDKLSFLYPFLFGAFPIIFLYAKNVFEVPAKKAYKLLLSYFIIFPCIYFSILHFAKDFNITSFFCFSYIALFYYLRLMAKNIVKKEPKVKIFNILLLSILILSISQITSLNFEIINKTLIFAAVLINLGPLMVIAKAATKIKNNKTELSPNNKIKNAPAENLPDIYFIIPDSYAGNEYLKRDLNYDNSTFLNFLNDNKFEVFEDAYSNYMLTNLSIASIMNIDYLQKFYTIDKTVDDQTNLYLISKPYFNNFVTTFLKEKGYTYYHLVNHWEKQLTTGSKLGDVEINLASPNDYERIFFQYTLINFITKRIFTSASRKNSLKTFKALENIHKEKGPKFVYAHLICPHSPYYFGENGEIPSKNLNPENSEDAKILYLNQLKYLNSRLKKTIQNILSHNKNSIIIIQSDHGSCFNLEANPSNWKTPNLDCYKERFNILRAIYTPNGLSQKDFRTSVNTFRAIFNEYFNENFEMLEENLFFASYDDGFNLKKINEEIFQN